MWADDLKPEETWWGIWKRLINCGNCGALITTDVPCRICGRDHRQVAKQKMLVNDQEIEVAAAYAGAIDWSTHVLLTLMQREWQRPLAREGQFDHMPVNKRPSQRLVIVLLFWSLFESLMDRFFNSGMRRLPDGVKADLLRRYSTIGSRLDRLYTIVFSAKFKDDLTVLGYDNIYDHLSLIQSRRNSFIHGSPEMIDDVLVNATVENLQIVQEAWVALYNFRCTRDLRHKT